MQQGLENDADDDTNVVCTTPWDCLGVVFYGGLINSDISSVLVAAEPQHISPGDLGFTSRFFIDLSFFIIIGCLLFNMVTGIIVDTFSSLREESQEVERLQTEETFISGLTYEALDGKGVTFDEVQHDQDLWNYVYYVIYLERKDPTEYDGLEVFVNECIANEDIKWFPHKTCASLERFRPQEDSGNDTENNDMTASGGDVENNSGGFSTIADREKLNQLLNKNQELLERLVSR